MMEPRIQYAKTSDDVSIAYWTMGEGPPLVIPPNLSASHLQMELDMPQRAVYEALARRLQVVRYDCRGVGMSQRDAIDFSVEAAECDLQAVVERLGLERFALYGHILAGQIPFAYAARHPDRVSGLVFWVGQTIQQMPEVWRQFEAIEPLMDSEWDLYVSIRSRLICGWDSPEGSRFAALVRAAYTPQSLRLALPAYRESLSGTWQQRVSVPALIMHLAGVEWPTNVARQLASSISTSHVLAIPGTPTTLYPFVYDNELFRAAIADFVETTWEVQEGPVRAPELNLNAVRAILWTDIEEHTQIMERLGDVRGRDLLREHERITRDELETHGGTEVKAMGDGFMAWFPSTQQALDCAIALQRSFADYNRSAAEPLRVRAGINAGEPIAEEDDLFGASVIAAARICRSARGGEVLVSDVVRQLAAGKRFLFADRGEVALRGFEEPVRLFEVRWRES